MTDLREVLQVRRRVACVRVDDRLLAYVVALVRATRDPGAVGLSDMGDAVAYGASPRGGIALVATARARAFLRGREYVLPEDVKALAPDVLRHRMILGFDAVVREISADELISRVLEEVAVP